MAKRRKIESPFVPRPGQHLMVTDDRQSDPKVKSAERNMLCFGLEFVLHWKTEETLELLLS